MSYKLPSEADEWGVGFNGDFLFEIQPDGTYDGDSIYMYLELQDGGCHDAYVTDNPEEEAKKVYRIATEFTAPLERYEP